LALIIKKIRYLALAKPSVGLVYGVSCGVTLLSYRVFLILALTIKKIRYLVLAKQLVRVFYGVSWDAAWLSYRDFLILAINIRNIRYLSRRDIDLLVTCGLIW